MRFRTNLLSVAALAVLGSARPGEGGQDERARRFELRERLRPSVVLLKTETGVASGVVLDADEGLVATSKARLLGAVRIEAYYFHLKKSADGRVEIERVRIGPAEVARLHRSADAALVRVPLPSELSPLEVSTDFPAPGAEIAVCGARGGVRFKYVSDLDARTGKVLERPAPSAEVVAMTAPTHLNSAGGAVLDSEGRLVGVANPGVPEGADGAATPLARFEELRGGGGEATSRAMSDEETAAHLARRKEPPPYLPVSPGGPEGQRVSFGEGVFAVKGTRAILVTGRFILDGREILEYFVCPLKDGKLHETVIAVEANPATINIALMARGYQSGGGVERLGDPGRPRGDGLLVYVEWDYNEAVAIQKYHDDFNPPWKRPRHEKVRELVGEGAIRWKPGPKIRVRAEDLMFDRTAGRPMEPTHWVYTGSSFVKDEETGRRLYMAATEGVFAAVYRDPYAVLNTPLKTGEDDIHYIVNDPVGPPRGTSCTLIFMPAPKARYGTVLPAEPDIRARPAGE